MSIHVATQVTYSFPTSVSLPPFSTSPLVVSYVVVYISAYVHVLFCVLESAPKLIIVKHHHACSEASGFPYVH